MTDYRDQLKTPGEENQTSKPYKLICFFCGMVFVRKLNGMTVPYDEAKLRYSLQRAGADRYVIDDILMNVQAILHEGMEIKVSHILAEAQALVRERNEQTTAVPHNTS